MTTDRLHVAGTLDHVARPPLPWRSADQALTECGQRAADTSVIDLDELAARWRRLGQQRASLTVCMTCFNRVSWAGRTVHQDSWDERPERLLAREIDRVGRSRSDAGHADREALRLELRALAMLADAHRDEFDAAVAGMRDATDLSAWREQRRMRGVQ